MMLRFLGGREGEGEREKEGGHDCCSLPFCAPLALLLSFSSLAPFIPGTDGVRTVSRFHVFVLC